MELNVVNIKGEDTGKKINLSDSIFGIQPNDHAIYLDVKQHLARRRQGTHKAKERGEIKGSTRKLKKQKGTGTARAGSIKSPVFKGGGRIFGPRPRDYDFKLNKKLKKLARISALSYKAGSSAITILEGFQMDSPRTKAYIELLKNLEAEQVKTLLILPELDNNIYLSSRNLSKAQVLPFDQLSTYDILHVDKLLIIEEAVPKMEEMLLNQ
ncbi:MAG: 50S ribosomal protein L4 [Microscillaceae bacterium]|nr:50S ribosomal protein L4 [Microscillaceae bacterium]